VVEAAPLQCISNRDFGDILKIESDHGNYDTHLPRTRAFLSHKRSSAQGVTKNSLPKMNCFLRLLEEFGKI
jgi:hypothetical protein